MAEEDRTLESLLNKATNPANRDEDWDHIMEFCDQVNKEIEGAQIAVKLLAHKIQSPQEREALYALTTLEGCVKNCGKKFHQEIGKFRFLNELIKVVSPKYLGKNTTDKVKRRCIELIYSWSRGLPHEAKIADAYTMLKQQGVVKEDPIYIEKTLQTFPPPGPREKNPIFDDDEKSNLLQKLLRSKNPQDLQAANRLIKNMVKQDTERMDKVSRRINQLQEINNNVKLLNEMLAHYSKETSSQSDRDMMRELCETLEKLRPNLFRLASDVDDKDNSGISDILTTNDDVMRVLSNYKKMVEGKSSIDESNLAFLKAGAGNLNSLLDLNDPSTPSKQAPAEPTQSSEILDEELLALGLGDIQKDKSGNENSLLGDLDEIFSAASQQNMVPATQTSNMFSIPSVQGGGFQSQLSGQYSQSQNTQLPTQSHMLSSQHMPVYNSQVFTQPQPSSQGWSFTDTSTVTSSQQKKPQQPVNSSLVDIDLLGQSLMQQSLPKDFVKPVPTPEKKTLNQMATKPAEGPLLATVSPFTTSQTTMTMSTPIISSSPATAPSPVTASPPKQEVQPLTDVFVAIETVQPGTSPPINAYDKNGLKILIHIAKNKPREDVHVMVVSVMSTSTSAVKNFSFQAAVPKVMKVKLQPPSATDLPAYNPILPPSAITQVMLLANPQNEKIRLKYKITYNMDNESCSDVGEVDNFVFA